MNAQQRAVVQQMVGALEAWRSYEKSFHMSLCDTEASLAAGRALLSEQPEALSDERIIDRGHRLAYRFKMLDEQHGCTTYLFNEAQLLLFARAIEKAHGIEGATE